MRKLIEYFIKYSISADVLLLLTAILGITSAVNIQRSQFPRVESRQLSIETIYIGASPAEVEKGITIKIEEAIDGLEGIKKVTSTSSENRSQVDVEILSSYLIEDILNDVKNAVDRINTFPLNAEKPVIFKRDRDYPAADILISGPVDLVTLKQIGEKAEQDLLRKKGISKVNLSGFPNQEIEIALRYDAMTTYAIRFDDVANAIKTNNIETTGGEIEMDNSKIIIRAENKRYIADQLENIIVKTGTNGTPVYLKDIARLTDQWEDRPNREYLNGKPAVKLQVSSRLNEDIIQSATQAKEFISEFNAQNDLVSAFLLRDGSIGIQQRTDLLVENGTLGFILVLLLLGLFLKPRIAFWVALSIPISICGMFFFAPMFGVNINMLSLFGLILVIGILVDDGVVIAENIYQKHEEGYPPAKAAIEGVLEVLPSVVSAVLTTCWFFMLFFLIEGQMGDFMSNIAFVVIATLLFSLIEGFFILPAHIAHTKDMQLNRKENKITRATTGIFEFLKYKIYKPILYFCVNNKTIALSASLVLLVICVNLVLGGYVKVTFFPNLDRDDVIINLQMPAGTHERSTMAILSQIEERIWEVNEQLSAQRADSNQVVLSINKSLSGISNRGTLNVSLLDGETRNMASSSISKQFELAVGPIYEAESLTFGQRSIFGAAIQVGFIGDNINSLRMAKDEFKAILKADKRLKNIEDNDQKGGLEFDIELTDKAKALNMNLATIINQIRQGYFGYEVQRLQRGSDEVKVWLRYDKEYRSSFENLENTKIQMGQNQYILKELVSLNPQYAPLNIIHASGKPKLDVSASMNDPNASATEIFNECRDSIIPKVLEKYPDVDVIYEGQSERAAETTDSMQRWLPIILLLVFFTVVLTFRSFTQAAIVIGLIPFAFIGVVTGHWLHGVSISILSMFGILAVAGVVINDSLVLINTMNRLLKAGTSFKDAVIQASISRFRPIVLTSATTVAGLMPIVLEKSLQAQFLIPMAISLAYGLLAATFIMLIVLPPLLIGMNNLKRFAWWVWEGEQLNPEEVEPSIIEDKKLQTH